jgi:hypothetical protein
MFSAWGCRCTDGSQDIGSAGTHSWIQPSCEVMHKIMTLINKNKRLLYFLTKSIILIMMMMMMITTATILLLLLLLLIIIIIRIIKTIKTILIWRGDAKFESKERYDWF